MLSLTSTGTELRRFRHGALPRIAVAAMLLIPLLYGALYLWAFWDPTGNLDKLPVALVNADRAATADGRSIDAGADVSAELLASGDLDWVVTDADDAATGVSDGTYYFALTIPADFSTQIASAGGDDPAAAELMVTYNDANSFLASTLGKSAMAQVRTAVSDSVSEQAVDTVLVGLGSARDGFAEASDGALTLTAASGQLADGATQVADGSGALADGAASAAAGASTLAAGAGDLADGATAAAAGSSKLAAGASSAATGSAQLATGAATAASGAATLSTGATAVADGTATAASSSAQLATGATQVAGGVDETVASVGALAGKLPALSAGLTSIGQYLGAQASAGDVTAAALLTGLQTATAALPDADALATMQADLATLDAGANDVATGATALSTGLDPLVAGTREVATGADALATGTSALSTGAGTLATGTSALSTGASTLAAGNGVLAAGAGQVFAGAGQLADGTGTLAAGSTTLADGAGQVADGVGQVGGGTQTLADALRSGADQIPADSAAQQTQRASVLSSPVSIDSTDSAQAEGFGEGFAPFFIPLALFVGALITWLLLRPVPPRALGTPASGWRTALAGYLPALAIGVGQVAIMLAVIHVGLGLQLASVAGTIAFTLLIVAAFLALQQMLNAVFGPAAGKVMILALLMLQLASSGGTYPVETTPAFFQVIHPLLPMSYAVSGLREVITGGIDARLWTAVAYLAVLLAVSLALTAWRAGRMRTWTLGRLHPVLEI
ncbi:YhgE/Pip domain-containing protein [Pengzhenrongella sicca]|uniref:YhgE/Pip domain-containing protein n=1 Tax=Pengzhenrongella sicca TaxID=2819238 RepID=A0A8A4ZBI7_9MICO|nr:YhgE/Pip domain-containing protein [Pengzhenrongella sicca]QTE28243.1 YhgE/Pip domain-containing protein [Pengzhenrongella sicca]